MSARQPFRPTPRQDSQPSSSQSDSKLFHSQRIDTDFGTAANKSYNLSVLFNQKKRDQSLPARKSKSYDDPQAPQKTLNNSWSAGSHSSKLDLSPAPSPVHSSAAPGLGNASDYQSSGMPSAQAEDIPSSPIVDNENVTSSFFAQEANPQHLLPMINEADEDAEMINATAAGSASLFFAGRYADVSSSRKRTQRADEDLDDLENINAKRFKPEQAPGSASRSHATSYAHAMHSEQLRANRRELDVLLGLDSDAYINENLKKYEDVKEKWANSSMEEWKAGGQEIANKFSEILDMVKDHMMQKMSLYADIQARIDEHKNALEERSKELTEAKRDLVKRSGSAIGQED